MSISQQAAMTGPVLDQGEWTRFWRDPRYHDLEGLSAQLVTYAYAPHRHETYVLGVLEGGAERFCYRGRGWVAEPGDVACLNPDELHDGEPASPAGFRYRMLYPAAALMAEAHREATGRAGLPFFPRPVVKDPPLARALARAHRALEGGADPLARDCDLLTALAGAIRRHADARPWPDAVPAGSHAGLARARALIEEAYGEPLDLTRLADEAGLSRWHFLRLFRRTHGQTPQAYLLDRRVAAARRALIAGTRPAEVAQLAGFSDQAHLTRAFKARYAVTPAVFGRAAQGRGGTGLAVASPPGRGAPGGV